MLVIILEQIEEVLQDFDFLKILLHYKKPVFPHMFQLGVQLDDEKYYL
jgi:hypothetical protein